MLLTVCLKKPRSYLYSHPEQSLQASCWQEFQALVTTRLKPTPIAYLLGHREFYSLEFDTSPVALIPRPETESLIEQALAIISENKIQRVLDLGTGTGNIAITIKKLCPDIKMVATDIDPSCVKLARHNATQHQVEIEFICSDWYDKLAGSQAFDLILSNPPYIAAGHPFMAQGDLPAEPKLALSPGESGLEALETIVRGAPAFLMPGGQIIVEHGYDQQAGIAGLLTQHGFENISCTMDLNDLPRISQARLIEKDGVTA